MQEMTGEHEHIFRCACNEIAILTSRRLTDYDELAEAAKDVIAAYGGDWHPSTVQKISMQRLRAAIWKVA